MRGPPGNETLFAPGIDVEHLRNALLTLTLTVPLLALGGVTPATLLIAAACVCGLAVVETIAARPRPRSGPARLLVGAAWAHAGLIALQLVPLPGAVLRLLAPRSAAVWAAADAAFGLGARAHPVSLDPPGTVFALATALTTAAFVHVVTAIASHREGRERIVQACIRAILVFGAVGLLARIWDHGVLFGLYTPRHAIQPDLPITPTLINPNHAAAAAAVAPPLLFGLAVEREALGARLLAGLGVVVTGALVVLTLSRGGIAVLVFEVLAMTVYAASWRRQGRILPLFLGFGALATAGATAAFVAGDALVHEVADGDLSKLDLIRRGARLALDHASFGVGRGAFASAFAAYESPAAGGLVRFSHPENLPVELASELGLPAAIALLGALLVALGRSARAALRRPTYAGALVAVVGIAVHEQFDFATEFAGVAMLTAAILAVVTSAPHAEGHARGSRASLLHDAAWAIALPLLGVALLRPHWRHSLDDDQREVAALWRDGQVHRAKAEVDAAALRHPADPYLALAAGVARLPGGEAGPHLIRAVSLSPHRAFTHIWLGRALLGFGRAPQAWGEYREALRLSAPAAEAVIADVVGFGAPLREIETMTTSESTLRLAVARLEGAKRPADAAALDEGFIERFPPAPEARLRRARRAAAAGDVAGALRQARELRDLVPNEGRAYILVAKLTPESLEAEAELERGVARCPDDPEVIEALLYRRGLRVGLEEVASLAERTRDLTLRKGLPVGRFQALMGSIELARKRPAKALDFYLDATATYPAAWGGVEACAAAAEATGSWTVAHLAWTRLSSNSPDDRRFAEGAARAHASMTQGASALPPSPQGADARP